jgi:hypothetical protein
MSQESMNDVEVQPIPAGSVMTEEMIAEYMSKYEVNRDVAIGAILVFEGGKGQPNTDFFAMFPTLGTAYYNAVAGAGTSTEDGSGEVPEVPAETPAEPVEEAAPSSDGAEV